MDTKRLRVAMDETYQDVEMLVHKICHEFLARKGVPEWDYDEWQAEASLAFVKAFHSFDRKHGARFSTWIWHCVWNALANKLRKECSHRHVRRLGRDEFDKLPDERAFSSPERFDLSDLSDDARTVVGIVFDSFGHADGRQKKPADIRAALQSLLVSMGWSWQRIAESFREIKAVLLNEP